MIDFENKVEKILCKTNEEGLELLSFLENNTKCKWVSDNKPTDIKLFSGSCNHHNAPLTIIINNNILTWTYEGEKYEISFNKFKEKYIETEDLRRLLQPGLIVRTRNNDRFILIKGTDTVFLSGKNAWISMSNIKEDLINEFNSDYDIMEIYQSNLGFNADFYLDTDIAYKVTVWKREETVELTLDEIANKFGIDIKQLKIKK